MPNANVCIQKGSLVKWEEYKGARIVVSCHRIHVVINGWLVNTKSDQLPWEPFSCWWSANCCNCRLESLDWLRDVIIEPFLNIGWRIEKSGRYPLTDWQTDGWEEVFRSFLQKERIRLAVWIKSLSIKKKLSWYLWHKDEPAACFCSNAFKRS